MKKIVWLVLALLVMLPGTALAHSKLENAIPDKESVVEASPQSIQMTFNTKIEKLSTFKLFNSSDEQMNISDIKVDGAVLSGTVPDTLANDEYTVKWTIIGADGHAVDGQYTFEVKSAASEPSNEPEATPDTEASPEPTVEPTTEPSAEPTASVQPSAAPDDSSADKDSSSNSTIYIVIAAAIIVIGLIVLAARRKK